MQTFKRKFSSGRRSFIKKSVMGFTLISTGFKNLLALSDILNTISKDYRPRFHFIIPDGARGPFDPSGNLFWKGRHHLFYIFTIYDERFPRNVANIHGHASSVDLINWTKHPWALVPEPEGPDSAGRCWSGDGFLWDGKPSIVYISNDGQTNLATSDDELLEKWEKHEANPIIPGQPVENQIQEGDHAPFVWKHNESWYCIRGGYLPGKGDTVFLFKSSDLLNWKYLHPLYLPTREFSEVIDDMACPEFFKLEDKYILFGLSHANGVHYYIGSWENEHFIPESYGRMNWPGGRYGAPESHVDDKGRRIMWSWALQGGSESPLARILAIPRVLTLSEDKKSLNIQPVEELEKLRNREFNRTLVNLPKNKEISFAEIKGDSLEIKAEIEPGNSSAIQIRVLCSEDKQEYTTIQADLIEKKLSIDVSKSSLDPPDLYKKFCHFTPIVKTEYNENPTVLVQEAPFSLAEGEKLQLQVYIDNCMIEVFANGRQALCMQVFPVKKDSLNVHFVAKDGHAKINKLQSWTMKEMTLEPSKA